ncbi:MAG: MBOAT family protein [Actinobacteria bacterium]|nr:MAG: MBOAT family protein [Actinomycetota bacterium]
MLFNSFVFLFVFLPVVVVAYFAIPAHRWRLVSIVLASYVFYAYAKWWFALLMVASTLVGYVGGQALERNRSKLLLGVTVASLLALLGAFKYAAFVGGNLTSFVGVITAHGFPGFHAFLNGIVLPIGISFYTFEGISYSVDVYRGNLQAERDPLRYAFFISFFPHLIAGPIVRYGFLRPQLLRRHPFDADRVRAGLLLFAVGLAKKTLVADGFATWVNRYLDDPSSLHAFEAWAAIVGFGFQIYFDFSAYSDMALGLAQIFGIELPWNFNRPYRASSPIDFWRRWHVTLSTWLRDYLYIPLGGNRKGERRRDANLLATMGLGGLWHGASLNFVVWGLYQGLLLLTTHHLRKRGWRVPAGVAVAITFVVVMFGWVFFRLHSAAAIGHAVAAMFLLHGLGQVPGHLVLLILAAIAYTMVVPEEWTWDVRSFGFARVATVGAVLAVAIASIYTSHPFIYFRF